MAGRVPDMRIATAVKGTGLEKTKSYIDQYNKLAEASPELARKMIEQEVVLGRINGNMLKAIMSAVRLQSAL